MQERDIFASKDVFILTLTEEKIWRETENQNQETVVLNTGTENHMVQQDAAT